MTTPLIDDLATLVAFPTVSNRPLTNLAGWLAQRLEDLGFDVERFEAAEQGKVNLVASKGPRGTDGLVLSGHMDVVPPDGQPWSCDPFVLTERDGRLLGRGTADMKGFFAATLQALETLRNVRLERELVLVWTHDEEVGCVGAGHLVDAWDVAGRPLPSACLIGEPTDFRPLRMHGGHATVHVDITGEAAHTSRPDLGHNAIDTAAVVVDVVRELALDLRRRPAPDLPLAQPWVPMSVVRIQGGTAMNIVPDHCHVEVGYRPLPGMPAAPVFAELRERIEARLGAERARATVRLGHVTPSLLTPDGTALGRLLAPHAAPGSEAAPYATDGGQLARLGTQPIVFGPGSIDQAHKADEYVEARDLERMVGILQQIVGSRCAP